MIFLKIYLQSHKDLLLSSQFGAEDRLHEAIEILWHLIVYVETRLHSILKLLLINVAVGVADNRGHHVIR